MVSRDNLGRSAPDKQWCSRDNLGISAPDKQWGNRYNFQDKLSVPGRLTNLHDSGPFVLAVGGG